MIEAVFQDLTDIACHLIVNVARAAGELLEHELELAEAQIQMKLTQMTQGKEREVAFLMVPVIVKRTR
jgi:hypothetical protein